METIAYIFIFFAWTLLLYIVHRLCHSIPFLKQIHLYHHEYVNDGQPQWMWQNIFLWSDDWGSTADLWVTEVVPTILFCAITGQWWIFLLYWVWTGFIQEWIEHNPRFNIPFLSAGKFHLQHHKNYNVNYSLFFPVWDWILGTYKDRNA